MEPLYTAVSLEDSGIPPTMQRQMSSPQILDFTPFRTILALPFLAPLFLLVVHGFIREVEVEEAHCSRFLDSVAFPQSADPPAPAPFASGLFYCRKLSKALIASLWLPVQNGPHDGCSTVHLSHVLPNFQGCWPRHSPNHLLLL